MQLRVNIYNKKKLYIYNGKKELVHIKTIFHIKNIVRYISDKKYCTQYCVKYDVQYFLCKI